MQSITSRRHFGHFYISVIFGSLFFLSLGLVVIALHHQALSPTKEVFMYIMGGVVMILGLYTPIRYFKNAPKIEVDNDTITFNSERFYWDQVQQIILTGKQPFKYLIGDTMEGGAFKFKDGSVKYMFDNMYSNTWEIKSFIQQVIVDKKLYVNGEAYTVETATADFEKFEYFKGSPFFSFRGIILWALIAIFMFMAVASPKKGGVVPLTMFCFVWFIFNSFLMDYFGISDHCLIVRNHNFIWKRKLYLLADVREIVFETKGKLPNCLRVITKDYKTKLFRAGTLNDNKWRELKKELESKGIKVRNELVL